MSMSVLIFSFVRKKKKSAKLDRPVKKLVSNFMEFSTNLPKCRPALKERTTTTTSSSATELKPSVNMKFCKDSMRLKKKKLMSNSREY